MVIYNDYIKLIILTWTRTIVKFQTMIDDDENYRMIKILFRKYDKDWKKKKRNDYKYDQSLIYTYTHGVPVKKWRLAKVPTKIDDE